MNRKRLYAALKDYSKILGDDFPPLCGTPIVAAQYYTPLKVISKFLRPGCSILDWGCGEGHFSYLLLKQNYLVNSYSFSTEDQLDKVRNTIELDLKKTWNVIKASNDPVTLPYQQESFDAVISLGVLEHVRESGGEEILSLKEIYRILKPSGLFLCFHLPNRYSWIEAMARCLQYMKFHKYNHTYRYTKSDILALLQSTLFQLLEIEKYNLFPRSSLRKLPKSFGWQDTLIQGYRGMEKIFSLLFKNFCQNYYFVLQK